jgi:5-methylcytosine-specific restriction endonuclease McrA
MTSIKKALSREHGKPVPVSDPTIDHVQPKALGGNNQMKNLVVACFECNNKIKDNEPMFPPTEKLNRWFRAVDRYRADQHQLPQPDPN